ncbi:MAG: MFS transporter [Rhodospirillales bacterium 20-60-12]|nr:MAG: MFS transporter [Rhodospirillales bacterium 20-60-12]HQT68418.1 MFS transporter [Acetobacteraceae bacterium]
MDARLATSPTISAGLVFLLAASAGIVVANIYYAQPLIGLIGPAIHLEPWAASLIVTLTQLGYALGLVFLVPLGDLFENRSLIVTTIAGSVLALALAAMAPNGTIFLIAAGLIGLSSVSVQMLVPMAAQLAPDASRGQVVGNVMAGLLLGILLARPVASMIAASFGWRAVFAASAMLVAIQAAILRFALPERSPKNRETYGGLLRSLGTLLIQTPVLQRRSAYQAAAFAAFSLFWTASPLLLAQQFGYSQRGIALFALVGAAGALAAPIAGRLADAGCGGRGTILSLLAVASSFVVAAGGAALHSVPLLAAAGVLLDAGVQSNLVFSQRTIYAMAPAIRSRLNGIFMALFFLGGAAGSAIASILFLHAGWNGICGIGALLALAAIGFYATERLKN